jgi:GMP synthase (glutamine-hydrolysing)
VYLHFTEVLGNDLDRPNVKAILIGGRSKPLSPDRDPEFFSLIRNTKIPMIGFCGGMHLIAKAFSAKVTSMRKLREGEADPNPKYHPGLFKEWGFLPVRITRRDPLFESLPDEILVREAHMAHMPQAPAEFEVLAATAECPVEAVKHRQRLLYATQFHPEAYDDQHPQGRTILQNFLRLAGIAQQPPVAQRKQ